MPSLRIQTLSHRLSGGSLIYQQSVYRVGDE